MSDKQFRRRFDADFKVTVIRKHLIEKIPVSQLCDEYQIKPCTFYNWQKELFDHGAAAFNVSQPPKENQRDKAIIEKLEQKLTQKNEVLAELMQEHLSLKKEYGEI